MSTRISSLILLAALTGCGERTADTNLLSEVEAQQAAKAAEDGRVACAPNGAAGFTRACVLERAQGEGGPVLTLRHPDGGFRRLLVTHDGRGVVAADGAEPAVVTLRGTDQIEVAVGGDRYLLPATARIEGQ